MAEPEDLAESIADSAQGPAEGSEGTVRFREHPLADQIAADKYLSGKAAAQADPRKGFTRVKIVPPGSV